MGTAAFPMFGQETTPVTRVESPFKLTQRGDKSIEVWNGTPATQELGEEPQPQRAPGTSTPGFNLAENSRSIGNDVGFGLNQTWVQI